MAYMDEMYFESAATILTLITIGKTLEAYSKGRTTDALKSLMKLAPKTATVVKDGVETEVSIDAVQQGDIFVVRPGENIPVDGMILEGHSAVNESALTGESIPVDKAEGGQRLGGHHQPVGLPALRATRVGEDTTLSQIIQMVGDAAATKAPIAKIARQGLRHLRAHRHHHCGDHHAGLAAAGPGCGLRPGPWHLGAGHQLPLFAGAGHAGGHHGGQRHGRQERRAVQDGGLPGAGR